jgi:NTE family protein
VVSRAIESGKLEVLAITATEIRTASSVTFVQAKAHKPWLRSKRRSEVAVITAQHILASSAIPFLFKAIPIGTLQYIDGSVRSSTPLSPAARLGATKIFSIGVRRFTEPVVLKIHKSLEVDPEPTASDIAGLILNSLFSDSLDSDAEHLIRINQLVKESGAALAANAVAMRPIEVFLARPSEDIGEVAKKFRHKLPFFLRYLLRGLGGEKARSNDVLSYLLFDGEYAKYLIDMGYRDAKAREDELAEFFV